MSERQAETEETERQRIEETVDKEVSDIKCFARLWALRAIPSVEIRVMSVSLIHT